MTGGPRVEQVPASAAEVDARAMDFILKRNLDGWTAADQAAFDTWLAQSLAHKTAYWRLNSVWSRSDRLSALRPLKPQAALQRRGPSRRTMILKVAAVLVLFAGAGGIGFLLSGPRTQTYATPVGGQKSIALADGSRIELNTNTLLRARVDARHRFVELVRGEAVFHIKHDDAHPFIVMAARHRITDLGTSFVVREQHDRLEVALLEGRARLETADAQVPAKRVAILTPGDEAVATTQQMSVTRKSVAKLQEQISWQRGVLIFHRATLAQVASEYNRYNSRKIVIADETVAARVMTATLPTTDLTTFARIARNFLGLHVEETRDEIVLSR